MTKRSVRKRIILFGIENIRGRIRKRNMIRTPPIYASKSDEVLVLLNKCLHVGDYRVQTKVLQVSDTKRCEGMYLIYASI